MTRQLPALLSAFILSLITQYAIASQWRPLFNGKDLSGWQPIAGADGHWKVADGNLYCEGGGGWLSTSEQYGDFELELEFRVPEAGNSGVFLRAPHQGNPAYQGMEIQVLDDYAEKYANLRPAQYTGSLYDVAPATKRVTKPAGQWQTMSILCDGRRVRVKVNGETIVDVNLDDHQEKLETHPGLNRVKGYIGLQGHGSRLDYRKIRIRALH